MPVISSGYNKLRRFHLSVESDLHLLWPCITALNDRLKKTTRANLSKPKSIVARSHAVSRAFFRLHGFASSFGFSFLVFVHSLYFIRICFIRISRLKFAKF